MVHNGDFVEGFDNVVPEPAWNFATTDIDVGSWYVLQPYDKPVEYVQE